MSARRDLSGSVVLITGGARGIGAATARALARRGAVVSVVGLEPQLLAGLAEELGEAHSWHEADVTDQHSLGAAVEATAARYGRIDVVVANAGIANYGSIHTVDPDAFARTVEVNLVGVYRTAAASAAWLARSHGYLLVVASIASFTPFPGAAAYGASKAGVESLAGALRTELSVDGVDVGVAHPCWIDTDLVRRAEDALPTFRRLRAALPWPARSTTSVQDCAEAFADAVARRASRVFVPRSAGLIALMRPLLVTPAAQRMTFRRAAEFVPALDEDVRRLAGPPPVAR